MKRILLISFAAMLGFGLALGDITSLNAQESDVDEFTLEEITVTAQKREENQQKVPISMEVLSAEDIKISGKTNLEDILEYSTGVIINRASDGMRVSLRGMSDDTTHYHGLPGSTPTVAINTDGVYSNRKDVGGLFDLERVEVLYGPQSTLYASNSPGGIVNVVSAAPKLDAYEISGTLEYGNYDKLHMEGSLNAPVGDTTALRAAFNTSVHDGYLSNGGDKEDTKAARLRALFQPNDKLSLVMTGELLKRSSYRFGGVDAFITQDDVDDPWYTERILGDPTKDNQKKAYANVDLDLGFGSLSLVPAYTTSDSHGENAMSMFGTVRYVVNIVTSKEKGAELRLTSSPDSSFSWILGLNYYDSAQSLDNDVYDANGDHTGEKNDAYMNEESKAVFTNITYPVTDRFRATVGYRMSRSDITTHREETKFPGGNYEFVLRHIVNSYDDPDYKVGIEYDLSEDSMVYVDHSTSYRSQGLEGAGPSGPGVEAANPPPEKLKAFTLGSKNRFFDNRVQVNASAYYYDYENYAVAEVVMAWAGDDVNNPMSDEVVREPGASTYGNGEQMGFDLQANTIITPNDNLNLSVSYLKSEWKDLKFTFYYDWDATGGRGGPPGSAAVPIEIRPLLDRDYGGKPMTNSPELTISANYTHIFNLANGGSLETRIDALHKGEYKLSWKEEDYPYNHQEAYTTFDLSATYVHSDGKWTLSTYVRNVENYAEKRGYFPRPINETHVGTPRTYGAVLILRY
jgi:iron complex outermembrane receptor protein